MADRLTLRVADHRAAALPEIDGRTLFTGQPSLRPPPRRRVGMETVAVGDRGPQGRAGPRDCASISSSRRTSFCRDGDYGAFLTSSEWLDGNYGTVLRKLRVAHVVATVHAQEFTKRRFADRAVMIGRVFRLDHGGGCAPAAMPQYGVHAG